jgi:hypothetical protein
MGDLGLSCACGQVQGSVAKVTPKSGTRINCYCADCQKFANWLGNGGPILDPGGGTDIFQIAIGRFKIIKGLENIRCVRLKRKGLYRWYTECCKTPIGNSSNAGGAFIGVIHNFRDTSKAGHEMTGPVLANIQTKAAIGPLAPDVKGNQYKALVRAVTKVLGWKLRGLSTPSPLFAMDCKAISKPLILAE